LFLSVLLSGTERRTALGKNNQKMLITPSIETSHIRHAAGAFSERLKQRESGDEHGDEQEEYGAVAPSQLPRIHNAIARVAKNVTRRI